MIDLENPLTNNQRNRNIVASQCQRTECLSVRRGQHKLPHSNSELDLSFRSTKIPGKVPNQRFKEWNRPPDEVKISMDAHSYGGSYHQHRGGRTDRDQLTLKKNAAVKTNKRQYHQSPHLKP